MPTAVGSSQPVFPHHSAISDSGRWQTVPGRGHGCGEGGQSLGTNGRIISHKQASLDPVSSPCLECCPPTPPDIHRRHFSPRSGLCSNVTSPGCSSDRSPTHSSVLTPFACLHRLARPASFLGQPQPMSTNQQRFSRSLEARCWQDHAPSEGSGREWGPSLTSCGSRRSLACGRVPPISAPIFTRPLLCVVSLLSCLL